MTTLFRVTTVAGALILGSLAFTTPLFAQGGPPPDGPRARRMGPGGPGFGPGFGPGPGGLLGDLGRGLRALDLSDGQREQLRGIMESRQAEFRAIGERLGEAHRGMEALITADAVDEAAIRAKSAEIAAVQADAAVLRARVHQEAFSILTAEQQARARELRAEREGRLKERASQARERRQPRRPAAR